MNSNKMNITRTPEEIMSMKSGSNAIVVHYNEMGPSLVPKLIMECKNADYWHKFVVENVETYERDFILKTILDFVYPADMIPVNFVKKKRAFFLARNNLDAILKLTSNKLIVPNPLNPENPLRLIIIANHYPAQLLKFDFEKDIVNILRKRFDSVKKHLDLSEFHKDSDLRDFFPLSQPKLLLYILQFAVEMQPEMLDLSNNSIKVINPIRLLAGCNLLTINLRNNEIARMEDLEPLRNFQTLQSIVLDGNPLCKDWEHYPYINKLRELCPRLNNIDGKAAFHNPVFTAEQKNFLCSLAGADLVSQFLEHFFMAYDSKNRQNLAPLYDTNALFSVTYRIIPNQRTCQNIQLSHYRCIDRNMKSFHGPRNEFLFRGQNAIMNVFASLPRSNHDPFTFRSDLIYYTEVQAILVVNGLFREDKRYIGFSRCFVLKCIDNTYCITNDQLHIYNALNMQLKICDCHPIRVEITSIPLPFYYHQYSELQQTVHKITNLNYDYSLRYLDACQYNLKKTLENFVEMHLKDEVPPEAFIQNGQAGLLNKDLSKNQKASYPPNLVSKTVLKHRVITTRTVWQTLKDERLAVEYTIANNDGNKDMLAAEAEEIKRKIVTPFPSNSVPILKSTDKLFKNTEQSQNQVTAASCGPAPDAPSCVLTPRQIARRRARQKRKLHIQQQIQLDQLGVPPLGVANQQINVSHLPTQPNGQQLQDTSPNSSLKELSEHPNVSGQNNLEQSIFQQSKPGSNSQNSTTVPLIDLTSGQTAETTTQPQENNLTPAELLRLNEVNLIKPGQRRRSRKRGQKARRQNRLKKMRSMEQQ